jgi:hypothetical protein
MTQMLIFVFKEENKNLKKKKKSYVVIPRQGIGKWV